MLMGKAKDARVRQEEPPLFGHEPLQDGLRDSHRDKKVAGEQISE